MSLSDIPSLFPAHCTHEDDFMSFKCIVLKKIILIPSIPAPLRDIVPPTGTTYMRPWLPGRLCYTAIDVAEEPIILLM